MTWNDHKAIEQGILLLLFLIILIKQNKFLCIIKLIIGPQKRLWFFFRTFVFVSNPTTFGKIHSFLFMKFNTRYKLISICYIGFLAEIYRCFLTLLRSCSFLYYQEFCLDRCQHLHHHLYVAASGLFKLENWSYTFGTELFTFILFILGMRKFGHLF